MQKAYGLDEAGKRKLSFLYHQSCINTRYSVIDDFGKPEDEWTFIPNDEKAAFPCLDARMSLYAEEALPLSLQAVEQCIEGIISPSEITHLITVSCTGMSAPGLDLQLYEHLGLSPNVFRTSVNFMGCYAAIHALKMAHMICGSSPEANVVIVATELCTLHFQKEFSPDNAASSLLFADGSAAVLVSNNHKKEHNIGLQSFYSQVALRGKGDMSWEISTKGFLMTLSSYIPQLIQECMRNVAQKPKR
jgi:predicted naringenin-chalcone synthase